MNKYFVIKQEKIEIYLVNCRVCGASDLAVHDLSVSCRKCGSQLAGTDQYSAATNWNKLMEVRNETRT
jgi:ribosomal protein S27AE